MGMLFLLHENLSAVRKEIPLKLSLLHVSSGVWEAGRRDIRIESLRLEKNSNITNI